MQRLQEMVLVEEAVLACVLPREEQDHLQVPVEELLTLLSGFPI
jgi:hypothetical protein